MILTYRIPYYPEKIPVLRKAIYGSFSILLVINILGGGSYAEQTALQKAESLLQNGQPEAATSIYEAYLKSSPNNAYVQLRLADIAIRQFNFSRAKTILERAITAHPDNSDILATFAHLYQCWGNQAALSPSKTANLNYKALTDEYFRQAMEANANNPLTLSYLAQWQLQQNDLVSAEKNLRKALSLSPSYIPALQQLSQFYIKVRDLSRAKDTVFYAMELAPNDALNHFMAAQLLATANRPTEAVKYALQSEQLDYGKLPARDQLLASQYEKLGEAAKATQYYERMVKTNGDDATSWLKLGQLYELQSLPQQSMAAFTRALQLKPDILNGLYDEARQNLRQEKIQTALEQWRRLLSIRPDDAATQAEGLGAIAGLRYLEFYQGLSTEKRAPKFLEDMQRVSIALQANPQDESLKLNRIQMQIVEKNDLEALKESLKSLSQSQEPSIAGFASFLLQDLAKTQSQLEQVEGLSAEEYAALADRLLLAQELQFSRVFYERANQLAPSANLQGTIKRIDAKRKLASQKVDQGNISFNQKNYPEAILLYQQAAHIYSQWDTVYLRLGDAYEMLKRWHEAKAAYDTAIALTPGLMNSQGFSKNYQRVSKKAK